MSLARWTIWLRKAAFRQGSMEFRRESRRLPAGVPRRGGPAFAPLTTTYERSGQSIRVGSKTAQ